MLLAPLLLGAVALGQVPSVADLELVDQTGASDSLADHREHVVVVMVVTARRLRNLKAWERQLRDRYEGTHYLRIADVPDDPPVTHERVAQKLVARVPDGVSILIDIERHWARELELDTSRPNLLLFDRRGRLAARFRGQATPGLLDEVGAALDRLAGSR